MLKQYLERESRILGFYSSVKSLRFLVLFVFFCIWGVWLLWGFEVCKEAPQERQELLQLRSYFLRPAQMVRCAKSGF